METLERGIAEREASLAQKDSLLQEARDERDRLREEHGQATADLTRELDEKTDKVKGLDQQVRTDSLFDYFWYWYRISFVSIRVLLLIYTLVYNRKRNYYSFYSSTHLAYARHGAILFIPLMAYHTKIPLKKEVFMDYQISATWHDSHRKPGKWKSSRKSLGTVVWSINLTKKEHHLKNKLAYWCTKHTLTGYQDSKETNEKLLSSFPSDD